MSKYDKEYNNGEITVFWKPELCIHSTECFNKLHEVFRPAERPWIQLEKSSTDKIISAVNNCPSGALSFKYIDKTGIKEEKPSDNSSVRIEVKHNGPLTVTGKCIIVNTDGTEIVKEGKFSLCRCGLSKKKPFCDASHNNLTHDL